MKRATAAAVIDPPETEEQPQPDQQEQQQEPPARVEGRKLTMSLQTALTDEELAERNHELRTAMDEADALESESKAVAKRYKTRIEAKHLRARSLALVCDERAELRTVECVELQDFAGNRVFVQRLDTGEQVSERAMTAHERQAALFPSTEENGAASPAAADQEPVNLRDEYAEQIGDDKAAELERVRCTRCSGSGGVFEGDELTGRVCPKCQGSGIEPGTLTDEQKANILAAIESEPEADEPPIDNDERGEG